MADKRLSDVLRTTKGHLFKMKNQLGIKTVKELLTHFPRAYNDTSTFTKLTELRTDVVNTVKGRITSLFNMRTKFGKTITRGIFEDQSGKIEVVWFNQAHLTKLLPRNSDIILSGRAKFAFGKVSLQNPSYELIRKDEEQIHSGRIVPVYHETDGISSKWLREKIKPLIDEWANSFNEHLPDTTLKNLNLVDLSRAIKDIHFPDNDEDLNKAKFRLAFDELFLLQLKALQEKWNFQHNIKEKSPEINSDTDISYFINSLPFTLTNAQNRVLNEIGEDLKKDFPMTRLVQGDVGSGKTIVALLSALKVIKSGFQVSLMAPTEILAKQHYLTFSKLLRAEGLNIQLIVGSTPQKQKDEIINQMKTGTLDIAIGTHALIQESIGFKKLGLAIIDEQHRFGVKQRNTLKTYGTPHLLSMTATPIPRTLAITIYGDQDLSVIDEMPKGRLEIITRHVSEKKRTDAYRWVEDQVLKGRQVFVICPLIEESETLELKAVYTEYDYLKTHIFPSLNLELLHGKMKQAEKDEIMEKFKNNETNILVSTSVIEVGIDIPNASIMIIEGAERFGLSQLHQFRGRVGRGSHQSYCFLFTNSLSEEGMKRMKAMESNSSGFKLSEIDLELRGPGEVYGVKQSGIPDLKMASLTDYKMIEIARNEASRIINEDPLLERHPMLQNKLAKTQNQYYGS
jgi:ATP-dependent DNA helicase RecG